MGNKEKTMTRIIVDTDAGKTRISRFVYGHFAEHLGHCIYGGFWVGPDSPIPNTRGIRNDLVAAMKAIRAPVLRWPGGCFADEYHWQDGVGPRERRPAMLNYHWGQVVENNHFGTHEFLDLCEQIGCEPYICGNVGSGTVREMQQWIEYLTYDGDSPMARWRKQNGREKPWRIKYWGVGNENGGCGGSMRPEYYKDEFQRYGTFCRNLSGNTLYRIACGAYNDYVEWTDVLMKNYCGILMQGLSYHYYASHSLMRRLSTRQATGFNEWDWYETMRVARLMDNYLRQHIAAMDRHDPERKVGFIVDEWGTWWEVEPATNPAFLRQQNTLRDALVAGLTLHIFHDYAERIHMANIAQTINVLQAMALTDGPRMALTPTYYVFEMFKEHQDALRLPTHVECDECGMEDARIPMISASASRADDGWALLTLCNLSLDREETVSVTITGGSVAEVSARVLTHENMDAHNTFDAPNAVKPAPLAGVEATRNGLRLRVPPKSVVAIRFRVKA